MSKLQYAFNPQNNQINPVTSVTHVDPVLRKKMISSDLYALVCKGQVTVGDIAAMFAVSKSPEILVKKNKAVQESIQNTAPVNTKVLEAGDVVDAVKDADKAKVDEKAAVNVSGAFDGRSMNKKNTAELLLMARNIGLKVLDDPEFAPTRFNLMKAIKVHAKAAEAKVEAVAEPVVEPVAKPVAEPVAESVAKGVTPAPAD